MPLSVKVGLGLLTLLAIASVVLSIVNADTYGVVVALVICAITALAWVRPRAWVRIVAMLIAGVLGILNMVGMLPLLLREAPLAEQLASWALAAAVAGGLMVIPVMLGTPAARGWFARR
jgi:hypothetical protein